MSREIKFRGVAACDVDGVYSDFVVKEGDMLCGQLVFQDKTPFIVGPVLETDSEYISLEHWCSVRPETVGQFIEERDKNGVDIYDGDIVKVSPESRVLFDAAGSDGSGVSEYQRVGWHHGAWMTGRSPFDPRRMNSMFWLWDGDIEVVGNIHQHPELLEPKAAEVNA